MHFAVLVIGPDVGRQLAPYGQRTRLSHYRQYVDDEEFQQVRKAWRKYPESDIDPDDGRAIVRYIADEYLSPDADGAIDRDQRGWYFYSVRNWLARWDYWTIGGTGREGSLLTKPGGAVVNPDAWYIDWPDLADRPDAWERAPAGQVLRGAQSCIRELDFDAMQREAEQCAGERWDAWQAARDLPGRTDELELKQVEGFTREQYLLRDGSWRPAYVVHDGMWHERGDRGLRSSVSDERAAEWRDHVDALIERQPDTTLITMVDCHT